MRPTFDGSALAAAAAMAALLALPAAVRIRGPAPGAAAPPAEEVVIVSPHNDAIRREFGAAFERWHTEQFGAPARVRWVVVGGTTEIARFLETQYAEAVRAWRRRLGRPWSPALAAALFRVEPPSDDLEGGEAAALWREFRSTDDPAAFTCRIDVLFGGGQYDFDRAAGQGWLVPPGPPEEFPADLLGPPEGPALIPEAIAGERLRTDRYFATALSAFGIVWNAERFDRLGLPPPRAWADLGDPRLFGEVALADPTKSGSVAKAFEMIVHQACREAVRAAGFDDEHTARWEAEIAAARLAPGILPAGVPEAYQAAVERGWLAGVRRIQRIAANTRHFADASSRLPLDVAGGEAAAALAIDFYARFQEQFSRGPAGRARLGFTAPAGGTSISGDPVARLRGAEHPRLATRFIRFVLSEAGQRLWTYRPGEPGGPVRYALRRLPARRDFYPSDHPPFAAAHRRHLGHAADPLSSPDVNPYELAGGFVYHPRWTSAHFGVLRDLVRAMAIDAHDELRSAWEAVIAAGGPEACPEAVERLARMPDRPEPLTWRSAIAPAVRIDRHDRMVEWTRWWRENYRRAEEIARSARTRAATAGRKGRRRAPAAVIAAGRAGPPPRRGCRPPSAGGPVRSRRRSRRGCAPARVPPSRGSRAA